VNGCYSRTVFTPDLPAAKLSCGPLLYVFIWHRLHLCMLAAAAAVEQLCRLVAFRPLLYFLQLARGASCMLAATSAAKQLGCISLHASPCVSEAR
jgi:hypothetical protein